MRFIFAALLSLVPCAASHAAVVDAAPLPSCVGGMTYALTLNPASPAPGGALAISFPNGSGNNWGLVVRTAQIVTAKAKGCIGIDLPVKYTGGTTFGATTPNDVCPSSSSQVWYVVLADRYGQTVSYTPFRPACS